MIAPTTTMLAYIPSPPQGVWYLGPVPIRAYALCIIVGIIVAVWWGNRRWVARGGQPGEVLDVAIWAVPFGLIGGRLYHLITDWRIYFGDGGKEPIDALKIWDGGLGIWGAVILGGVGAWIGARRIGIRLPPFADAIAPAILLAQAIGRLGNYFNQELYGRPTSLPWGLEIFERTNSAGQTSPALIDGHSTGQVYAVVQPTFLYELLWNLAIVVLLVVVDRQFRIGHGRLFALYVAGYCAGRFVIEMLRSDPAFTHIAGVRINVFVAALLFVGAAIYFVVAPKGREVGLSMYWPWRADELRELGEVGYVGDRDDRDGDDRDGDDRDGGGERTAATGKVAAGAAAAAAGAGAAVAGGAALAGAAARSDDDARAADDASADETVETESDGEVAQAESEAAEGVAVDEGDVDVQGVDVDEEFLADGEMTDAGSADEPIELEEIDESATAPDEDAASEATEVDTAAVDGASADPVEADAAETDAGETDAAETDAGETDTVELSTDAETPGEVAEADAEASEGAAVDEGDTAEGVDVDEEFLADGEMTDAGSADEPIELAPIEPDANDDADRPAGEADRPADDENPS